MSNANDKLVQANNEFKKSLNGKTISIHGKEYATVALRVAIARRVLGTALDVVTKIVSIDKDTVVMQADIIIDGKHVSTGHAEENRKASRINTTSALENAETSAVGRALAFCAFISDGIASAEEVSTAIEQQDKKIQSALKDLNAVSHAGNFKEWISNNKVFLSDLKANNPIIYKDFMEKFTSVKSNLQTRGVI
jgi:spore germination protein GerM